MARAKSAPAPVKGGGIVVRTGGGALPALDDPALRDRIAAAKARTMAPATNFISLDNQKFNVPGIKDPVTELEVVILNWGYVNQYYNQAYKKGVKTSPVCFALSLKPDGMVPHEAAPTKQHDTCRGCPQDQWGSARQGDGKACRNTTRMVVLMADELTGPEAINKAKPYVLTIPPTCNASFSLYVNTLLRDNREPFQVATKVTIDPDSKSDNITWETYGYVETREDYDALIKRNGDAEATILQPPQIVAAAAGGAAKKGGASRFSK